MKSREDSNKKRWVCGECGHAQPQNLMCGKCGSNKEKREAKQTSQPKFTCFSCRDGNTPLYCLNCADDILKASKATAPERKLDLATFLEGKIDPRYVMLIRREVRIVSKAMDEREKELESLKRVNAAMAEKLRAALMTLKEE